MCDTLVSVTDDGVLFAKNSDRDAGESQFLDWIPARDHVTDAPDGPTAVRCTWIEVPQVARTNAVLLSRPWWMFGAETGANAHGVVIGNEAVFTRELRNRRRLGDTGPGLLGMDMVRLALERAANAADAVQTIVTLLEAHGQAGRCSHEHAGFTYDNSFLVADPDGAIVLETAGRSHATEEVRFGGRAISNGLTIPAFAAAHADPLRGRVAACATRRARTEAAAASVLRSPERRAVADLAAALRDHGPDGLPRWSRINGALRAPCAHAGGLMTATQTTSSWIADLRDHEEALHWVTATAAPCTSLFKPVHVGDPVDLGPPPVDRFDPATTWWRHEVLHRAAMVDPQALLPRFTPERDALEAAWFDAPPSTREAFATATEVDQRWAADVIAAAQPDRRPGFVRRYWAGRDAAAGLPTGRGPGSDRYRPALERLRDGTDTTAASPTATSATGATTGASR